MRGSSFRRGSPARLGGLVNSSLDQLGLRHKVLEHQAVGRWKEIVGPHIAASSVAERVRDGVLFVACKSSMWSNELSLHKQDIIKRYQKAMGRKVITDIRFSARGFKRAFEQAAREERPAEQTNIDAVPLGQADMEIASRVASKAPAKELAAKIEKAIITSKRLAELKRREGWRECRGCSALHDGSHDLCDNCR